GTESIGRREEMNFDIHYSTKGHTRTIDKKKSDQVTREKNSFREGNIERMRSDFSPCVFVVESDSSLRASIRHSHNNHHIVIGTQEILCWARVSVHTPHVLDTMRVE
ncbi:hypothetical protein PFISCL1PPCAC_17081, partial [Pristionchus fissidentatus]